jgi:hypothetical protein
MPTAYKVLGQSSPSSASATTLYTVPASTETVISTISVCNRGSSSGTFRIAVRPNGDTLADEHYIVYDASCSAKDTITFTIGITMDASDVLTIYASTADFSFSAFGSELS